MQISDSGFRGEINVVSPGRRTSFSHENAITLTLKTNPN